VRAGQVGGPSAWDGFAAAVAADACVEAQQSGAIVKVGLPDRPKFYG
jgi:myo-inositol 2-dehydrogenase/D-chiro-inositol 1-dehydrogenase